MFGIQDYGAFVAAVIVFLAIPGPGNFAVITSTGKGRIRGGLAATFGIIAGDQVLMWLAVAGVAALLKANPAVFAAVQYAGAAYLAWLGFQMLRANLQVVQLGRQAQAFVIGSALHFVALAVDVAAVLGSNLHLLDHRISQVAQCFT